MSTSLLPECQTHSPAKVLIVEGDVSYAAQLRAVCGDASCATLDANLPQQTLLQALHRQLSGLNGPAPALLIIDGTLQGINQVIHALLPALGKTRLIISMEMTTSAMLQSWYRSCASATFLRCGSKEKVAELINQMKSAA